MTPRNYIRDHYPGVLVADGFDEAILGILVRPNGPPVVVYDAVRMHDIVMQDGVDEAEAREHLEHNVWCGWLGDRTPLYATLEGPRWQR